MFNDKQIELLNSQLDSSRIKKRSKGNISLSYLEGHDILDTANIVFGFGNWDYDISILDSVSSEMNQNQNHIVCYKAVVQITVHNEEHTHSISRTDVEFGSGIAKTLADANEGGAKEAVTDAIKRAMRSFGNQFGNSLYSKDKNHTSNNQQYNNPQQSNSGYQQQQNYPSHKQQNQSYNQPHQTPYQNSQDFSTLINLGLQIVDDHNGNLLVIGDSVFENKEAIKAHSFRWDGQNKQWYLPLNQAA